MTPQANLARINTCSAASKQAEPAVVLQDSSLIMPHYVKNGLIMNMLPSSEFCTNQHMLGRKPTGRTSHCPSGQSSDYVRLSQQWPDQAILEDGDIGFA